MVPELESSLPAHPAVAGDAHVLHRPIGQAAGPDPGVGQAVDVQVVEVDVGRVLGVDADGGPEAVGVGVALAGQASRVEFHAIGVVGDLQTGDLDIAGVGEVKDHVRSLGAPQLGWVGTAAVPALAQDAGGVGRIGAAGDGGHVAVPWIVRVAVVGAGRAVAHHVAAGADDQGVAAGDARRAAGGKGAEGMVPGWLVPLPG